MDKSGLLKIIRQQISEIGAMVDDFENIKQIQEIDVDILLDKIRNLYKEVKLLPQDFEPANQSTVSKPVVEAKRSVEPMVEKAVTPKPVPPTPVKEAAPETPPEPVIESEPVKASASPHEDEPMKDAEPVSADKPTLTEIFQDQLKPKATTDSSEATEVRAKKDSPKTDTLSDRLKPSSDSVNEALAKQQSPGQSKPKLQPVEDIYVAIGLNDRFMFTRELFNNDSTLFKQTITELNNLSGIKEAQEFLNAKFNWDSNDQSVQAFINLVQRRYL